MYRKYIYTYINILLETNINKFYITLCTRFNGDGEITSKHMFT